MATWEQLEAEAPELAERVQARFAAHKHILIATLRRDGGPRISGVEVQFSAGQLWIGMMGGSRKAADLQRDPRVALHSAPVDLELADGDAKVSGRATEVVDEPRSPPGWATSARNRRVRSTSSGWRSTRSRSSGWRVTGW